MSNVVGQAILGTTEGVKDFQKQFQAFTAYNIAFVTIAAGISVGLATNEMITHIMNDAVLPLFMFVAQRNFTYYIYNRVLDMAVKHPLLSMVIRKCGRIVWLLAVWFIVLYLTFIIFSVVIRFDSIGRQMSFVQLVTKRLTGQELPPHHTEK
jgi:uncharacterized membrane protein